MTSVELDRLPAPRASTASPKPGTRNACPVAFHGILFERAYEGFEKEPTEPPDIFGDLNLDQIVAAITAGKEEYDLKPFFYAPLPDVDAVGYRHEVMQDLESPILLEHVRSFARRMRQIREHLTQADKLNYRHQKEAWFLHTVEIYGDAIKGFVADLCLVPLSSRGFLDFREYLTSYAAGTYFTSLVDETTALKADLSAVRYSVLIKDNSFTVQNYESEADYSAEIDETFEKFQQKAAKDYLVHYRHSPEDMNHIEAVILDFVAQLNPALFSRLDGYRARHAGFIDKTISAFDREIHFYVGYLDYISKMKRTGLRFCYPRVCDKSKEIYDCEGFDLALAQKLIDQKASIVCNDFFLKGEERIIVVTGPNQGGKTTFARTFGQLHYLASLGCPVPGRKAQLFLFDRLFTHFEREEKIENLRGKLEDDLMRIRSILEQATSRSIVVMNEIFTSTTLQDEIYLGRKVMEKIIELDALCVWVTFVDELASFGPQVVSMVSAIVPENPALRTFKIVRRPADGLAYAMAIAEKYRLTYDRIKERIRS